VFFIIINYYIKIGRPALPTAVEQPIFKQAYGTLRYLVEGKWKVFISGNSGFAVIVINKSGLPNARQICMKSANAS
jgi:hypothetical protein